jgi:hypothetical protein
MKPIAALIALLALAVTPAPAAAEERLAVESAPFTADAYGDVIAWSSAGVERNPSIHRSALGFVREVHRRPVVPGPAGHRPDRHEVLRAPAHGPEPSSRGQTPG